MNTRSFLLFFLIVCFLILGLVWSFSQAKMPTSPSIELISPAENEVAKPTSLGTFWQLTARAGGLRWAIFAVFILGLFLVFWKMFELYTEWKRSARLMKIDFRRLSLEDIVREVQGESKNILSSIIVALLNLFHSTGSANGLSEEISTFLKYQQDRFDTFKTRLAFLSDTAGALGLLGTVWGMFLTFFSGNLDKQQILNGMGIALLTTLLGLIVSIILNLSGTEVYSLFNKILDRVAQKSEELRFRLLELSNQGVQPAPLAVSGLGMMPAQIEKSPSTPESVLSNEPQPTFIEILNGLPKQIIAGQEPIPCEIQVLDSQRQPLKNIEVSVELSTPSAGIGDLKTQQWKGRTNQEGRLQWQVVVGTKPDNLKMRIFPSSFTTAEATVEAEIVPAAASDLKILGGNHQSAPIGARLPRPLKIAVYDAFRNAIPNIACKLSVSADEGVFENGKPQIEVYTDEHGIASVPFVLGTKPGLIIVQCSVINADLETQFELFAQEES